MEEPLGPAVHADLNSSTILNIPLKTDLRIPVEMTTKGNESMELPVVLPCLNEVETLRVCIVGAQEQLEGLLNCWRFQKA
jgi:hypothetical protein